MSERNLPKGLGASPFVGLHKAFSRVLPQIYSQLSGDDSFQELRVYIRPDGSCLALLKGFDGDGGPVIAFGTGFEPMSALLGLEGTVAAGNWMVDRPWSKDAG